VTGSASSREGLELGGSVFDGRFEIERRIAEGGFAVVYKARQVALDRLVALKVLKARATGDEAARAEFREKFGAEAQTIARLRHPHIVDVYDFAVSALPSGELAAWMALEWLEGETLATRLRRRREAGATGLPPREALALLRPVLEALAYAHGQGVVHRDVKPSNIMVTPTPDGETPRVLDFGIAKIVAADELPRTGDTRTESAPVFSPAYAAPEQVAFSRTGAWTDVHALGLVLAELMTDAPPFVDSDPEAHLFEQVMARTRPTPASKGKDVGPFEPVLARALALSPRDRWRSAGDLLNALEEAARTPEVGDAAAAREASPSRRMVTTIGVALLTLALAGLGWRRHLGSRDRRPPVSLARHPPVTAIPAASKPEAPASITPAAVPAVARAKPIRTVIHRRRKQPPTPLEDGRDLFDDTK
jgi:eukaryotic-like serine/threonine-protein kinase